jgi:hypothetical protein
MDSLDSWPELRKIDMRFGESNARSLYSYVVMLSYDEHFRE